MWKSVPLASGPQLHTRKHNSKPAAIRLSHVHEVSGSSRDTRIDLVSSSSQKDSFIVKVSGRDFSYEQRVGHHNTRG